MEVKKCCGTCLYWKLIGKSTYNNLYGQCHYPINKIDIPNAVFLETHLVYYKAGENCPCWE